MLDQGLMKNILVTGGAGSIGVNFIGYLLEEIHFSGRIVNVDKLTYAGNLLSLEGVEKKFPDQYVFENADICDVRKISDIFAKYQIDTVVHFAAESQVDRSIENPDQFIQTNIVGTFNLLEVSRGNLARLKRFHYVSTDEIYGSLNKNGYATEESPYRPNSPYAAAKAAANHLVRAYVKTYGLPATISNSCNNYGPYHHIEKLIPLVIVNAWQGKRLPVYGDGLHIRDWLYVRDHCRAIWLILEKGKEGEAYNVASHNERTNLSVVETICDTLDQIKPHPKIKSRRELITFVKDRPGHDLRYGMDFTKIREELGFEPEESFESGIKKVIHWYLDNPHWVQAVASDEFNNWYEEHYFS